MNLLRNNMSVGVVCMTINTEEDESNSSLSQTQWKPAVFGYWSHGRGLSTEDDEQCPGELDREDNGYGEVSPLPTASHTEDFVMVLTA